MALDIPVYDMNATEKVLPTAFVYSRAAEAWHVNGGSIVQLPANAPMWDVLGLVVEDASTNLAEVSSPGSGSEFTNASLYAFPYAKSMRPGVNGVSHASMANDSPVREADDTLPDNTVALACAWTMTEMISGVYIDIGFRDANQNWLDRARYTSLYNTAYPLPSDRQDMAAIWSLVSSVGPNSRPVIMLACVSPTGADAREVGFAPSGDYQNHLLAVMHHLQVEAMPGPTSPIVTVGAPVTRNRATVIAAVQDVGADRTTVHVKAIMPLWMGRRQVIWQMDADTDVDASRVALERSESGQLQVVCAGTTLSLGHIANGESCGVAFKISDGTIRASRDGLAVVSASGTLPAATKERLGHGYAAGVSFHGKISRARRWLSVATDPELLELSVDTGGLAGDQDNLVVPPLYAAEFSRASMPAVLKENALFPSSGNARLLPVYAGELSAGVSKLVYRKAKADEISYAKGTRWENMTGAAYVDQDTLSIGGSNVTAVGNATHLGLPCNYITWSAGVHTGGATSTVSDNHGISGVVGQQFLARIDLSVSRPLVSDETINLNIWTSSGAGPSKRIISAADDIQSGTFYAIMIDEYAYINQAASLTLFYEIAGTFSSPLTIYVRRRMLFDASGLDASECVPDFVDPAVVYNAVAAGVKWLPTKCGNTVAANGVIIPGTGAALPEPMGVQWQPAATGLAANSPPTSGTEITVTNAPAAVAGLPAKRVAANSNNESHLIESTTTPGSCNTPNVLIALIKRNDASVLRPTIYFYSHAWSGDYNDEYRINAEWTAFELLQHVGTTGLVSPTINKITHLGNNDYLLEFGLPLIPALSALTWTLYMTVAGNGAFVGGANDYVDIAALNAVAQAYAGTPMLASGGATARLADDPATGLPAIGTGPFTAFVEITPNILGSSAISWYPKIFCADGDGLGVLLYDGNAGAIHFYTDNITSVNGACTIAVGTRAKLVIKRNAVGVVSVFKDGLLTASYLGGTIFNCINPPKFGSASAGYETPMLFHANRLYYTALSDAECIAMTTL